MKDQIASLNWTVSEIQQDPTSYRRVVDEWMSGDLDVHTVMHDQAGRRHAGPSLPRGLTLRRRIAGAVLTGIAAAAWFASRAWTAVSGPPIPTAGYVAMTLGIVFSLLVGCGLMALLFYSNRHGYDDQFKPGDDAK